MRIRDEDACIAFLVMRLGMGFTFFFFGLRKVLMYPGIADIFRERFAETWLPDILVAAFGYSIPFVELILGALVVLGLFTRPALYLMGLTMVTLNFGLAVEGDSQGVAKNIPYLILIGLDILLLNYNKYSLDNLLFQTYASRE